MNQTDSAAAQNHSVYLISNGRHVKIGHATDPRARFSNIQTSSSDDLVLSHWWTMDRPKALRFEKAMHRCLHYLHVRGEWFDIDPQVAMFYGNAMLKGDRDEMIEVVTLGMSIREAEDEIELSRRELGRKPTPNYRRALERDIAEYEDILRQERDALEWFWPEDDAEAA